MTSWNFADAWEATAVERSDEPALLHGDRVLSWADFDRQADAIAFELLGRGLTDQAKVASMLFNGPEYLAICFGTMKASLVPVNINFRYSATEVAYLLEDSDTEAFFFHSSLADVVDQARASAPRVKHWYAVDDSRGVPAWATSYQQLVTAYTGPTVAPPGGRSEQDLILLYTGGTTGAPKGVMWEQGQLYRALDKAQFLSSETTPGRGPARPARNQVGPRLLPASPLVHGAAFFSAFNALIQGGSVVTLPNRKLDADLLWSTVERHRVTTMGLVGDAFARPLVEALDADPGRWDLTSLTSMASSGAAWSPDIKRRLLGHIPALTLIDILGSTEAIGLARTMSTRTSALGSGNFTASSAVRLLAPDGRVLPLVPGSQGLVAISGNLPSGYYKDDEKSRQTFPTLEGVRYSVPGDMATVCDDGSLRLLGRGSACINSGGEKIFPEEIDELLKTHPSVADAACVGLPDRRFGEVVCAIVVAERGSAVDAAELMDYVGSRLARFKIPRRVLAVDGLSRGAAGKLNYPHLRQLARDRLAETPPLGDGTATGDDLGPHALRERVVTTTTFHDEENTR
jgi:acyl-CoA synthetase (AMP-forming)/AMP-acid ligase II